MNSKHTGEFIAELRKEQGMTQTALAEQLNISNRTVSKWENGDGYPDITSIPKLAEILGVTADELLSGERVQTEPAKEPEKVYFNLTYTETARGWREAMRAFAGRKVPYWFFLLANSVFVFLLILMSTATYYNNYRLSMVHRVAAIAIAVIVLVMIIITESFGYISIKNAKDMNNGVKPPTNTVFADKIYCHEGCVNQDFDYNINQFIKCKNIYLLIIGKRIMLQIPKSAVSGREAEFEEFISSRAKSTTKSGAKLWHKIVASLLVLTIAAVVIYGAVLYISSAKDAYYYKDIDSKLNYYLDNEKAFDFGLKNVTEDTEIMAEVEQEGETAYWAGDYLPLEEISDVEITNYAVTFNASFSDKYYNGYIYYEGEGNPMPYQIGFRKTGVDDYEGVYVADEDLYLYGKEDNESPTKTAWYLVKPVGENWYYYEYHTDDQ